MNRRKTKEAVAGYVFITPATIILVTFIILPIFMSLYLSFTKFNGFSAPSWVGLQNYIGMFSDKQFLASLRNTFIYVLVTVPCRTFISLIFAAILAAKFRNPFGEFIRGTMFIPVLCSASIAGTIFFYLFSSESQSVANMFIGLFGLEKVNWLGQPGTALAIICLVGIWKDIGYFLVIFYAGIMDVPNNLYEAAKMDGASSVQQFFYVTLPSIKPIIYLVITLCTIWAFQTFDITYVMTKGGPGNATVSPVLVVYNNAFTKGRMGYACAVSCILAIIIMIITVIQRTAFNEKAGGSDD